MPLCALPGDWADVSTVEDLLHVNPLGGCQTEQLILRTHAPTCVSSERTLEVTSLTEVFIPTGGLVASIQADYTIITPEPSHFLAAGMFLAALLARRRFSARSGD